MEQIDVKQALIGQIKEKVKELLNIPEVEEERRIRQALKILKTNIIQQALYVLEDGARKIRAIEPQSRFVTKYSIKVLGDSQVSFKLPRGTSRVDLMNEAQALAPELFKKKAVSPSCLEIWNNDLAFTEKVMLDLEKSIDGSIKSSNLMTRTEQEARGWNNIDMRDLATAHVAYLIATGQDLFANNVVRARDGALGFNDGGLSVSNYRDDLRGFYIAASAALPQ